MMDPEPTLIDRFSRGEHDAAGMVSFLSKGMPEGHSVLSIGAQAQGPIEFVISDGHRWVKQAIHEDDFQRILQMPNRERVLREALLVRRQVALLHLRAHRQHGKKAGA